MITIWAHLIFQRAVKAWIIATYIPILTNIYSKIFSKIYIMKMFRGFPFEICWKDIVLGFPAVICQQQKRSSFINFFIDQSDVKSWLFANSIVNEIFISHETPHPFPPCNVKFINFNIKSNQDGLTITTVTHFETVLKFTLKLYHQASPAKCVTDSRFL